MVQIISTLQEFISGDAQTVYSFTGLVKQIYRTEQGLNIFTVSDGDTSLKLVAFTRSGVAYGEIQEGSVATFHIKQKPYDGEMQGTIVDATSAVSGVDALALRRQLLLKEYTSFRPSSDELKIQTYDFEHLQPSLLTAATLIKGAVASKRPILITHHNDTDGYSAGILLERAIKKLLEESHGDIRYLQNYLQRNPSRTPYYDLTDVTRDIAFFQLNQQRAGTASPLILIVDNGSTDQDLLAIQKASIFGADVIVIDHHDPGVKDDQGKTPICHHTLAHVNPHLQGITKDISASMLCYQLADFLGDEPSALLGALGGVADRCEGSSIDQLIKLSGKTRERLQVVGRCIDYEIYQTKFNHSTGALYELFDGEQQDALVDLYVPLLEAEKKKIAASLQHYVVEETIGDFTVHFLDGEGLSLWGDYFSIGKLAGLFHDTVEKENHITVVHSNSIIVFRCAQKNHSFDVNVLLKELQETHPHIRVDGGGHAVAGSLRFISIAKDEVLDFIKTFIKKQ